MRYFVIASCVLLVSTVWMSSAATGTELHHRIFQAIERGDDTLLDTLLRQGTPVNLRSANGTTPLLHASLHGTKHSVEHLLRHGADPNAANDAGITPLMWSAGNIAKVKLLLTHGANVDQRSALGNTPLIIAAAFPEGTNAVKALLAADAEPFATNKRNSDALANAVRTGSPESVQAILQMGTTQQIQESINQKNLLGDAADRGSMPIVQLLLRHTDDVNGKSDGRGRPLHAALLADQPEIAKLFIERGAMLNRFVPTGKVPTFLFATYNERGDDSLVEMMLDRNVDVHVVNERGENALTWARRRGHHETAQRLKHAGVAEIADPTPTLPDRSVNLHAGNWDQQIRQAAQKSVRLMQFSSDRFLEKRKNCVSCHNQNLTGVAIGWARERGLEVDEASIQTMLDRQERRRRSSIERAYQMDDPYPVASRFVGWGLWGFSALGYPNNEVTESLTWYLAATQHPEGYWFDGFLRPPMGGGPVVSTVLAMRSLQLYPLAAHHRLPDRVERAAHWLEQVSPRYHQEQVFQLLGLGWSGRTDDELRNQTNALLATQRKDGGWSQLKNLPSDAWATGQCLVALRIAGGIQPTHPSYRKGIEFLLKTQFDDGAWFVKSRSYPFQPQFDSGFPFGADQWISAGGTAWATMALLLALEPTKDTKIPMRGDPRPLANATKTESHVPIAASSASSSAPVEFAKHIKPLFERSCVGCHSGDSPEANLVFDSRERLLRGGDSGDPSIVPGDRNRSPLFHLISSKENDLQMPPKDARDEFPAFSPAEIETLGIWIDRGAKWADGI